VLLSAAFTVVCELLQVTTLQLTEAVLSCKLIYARCSFPPAYQKARIAEWTKVSKARCSSLHISGGPLKTQLCVSVGFILSQTLSLSDIVDSVRVARCLLRQDECSRAKLVTCRRRSNSTKCLARVRKQSSTCAFYRVQQSRASGWLSSQ